MNNKGFILIIMLFLLLLLAITAMSLNVKSGMQVKMAANQTVDVQTYYDQLAVIEQSVWQLAGDPCWRVPSGENYTYNGTTYTRKVFKPALAAYDDAVVISIKSPAAARSASKSYRYNIETPVQVRKPRQVSLDGAGNIFFADVDNHSVWKIDTFTGAILRVAGTGMSDFGGDGGPATEAHLDSPRGVWADGQGNLFIADTNNNRIRKVTAGIISTVAGTGSSGSSGDNGAATAARLNSPQGVWVDASGNIFIADTDNHRIRKVAAGTNIITTFAGTTQGYAGNGGLATSAQLDSPDGVCGDATGNIFIADTRNNRVRKVAVGTNIITRVAGSGNSGGPGDYSGDGGDALSAELYYPQSLSVDMAGNIYIADTNNHRIRKVTAASGIITTKAGIGIAGYGGDGGAATAAQINYPTGVFVKNTGEVVISDTNNGCLRQVSITNIITTLSITAGPGLNNPQRIAAYYDAVQKKLFLYIADRDNNCIRKLDTVTNAIVMVAGTGSAGSSGDNGQAIAAQLNSPTGVAADASANLYIADTGNNKIRKITAATGIITTVAGTGISGSLGDNGAATSARLDSPQGVWVDAAGNIFIADTGNHRIRKVAAGTNIITTFAGTNQGYSGNGGLATSAQLDNPGGVYGDASGNIFIADTRNNRIRKVAAGTNIITRVAGSGNWGGAGSYSGDGGDALSAELYYPQSLSVDMAGNIYIADTRNNVLRLVNIHDGAISTMAGTGNNGYNGDRQPAVQARLNRPGGVALGLMKGGGRIFISDTNNNRIRMLFLKTVKELYGP